MDSFQPPEPLTHAVIIKRTRRDTNLWHGQGFVLRPAIGWVAFLESVSSSKPPISASVSP